MYLISILGQEFMAQCVSDIYFGTRVYGAVCIWYQFWDESIWCSVYLISILGPEFMAQCVSDICFGMRVYGAVCI